jgi:hypothetical protein
MAIRNDNIDSKCMTTVPRNFRVLYDEEKLDLDWMPYETFLTLLRHPNLSLNEEYALYRVIRSYLRRRRILEELSTTSKNMTFLKLFVFRILTTNN